MNATSESLTLLKQFLEKRALTFKMGWMIFLVLVLLIPLGMIRSVIRERMGRRDQAVADITSTWGREQVIAGPVLVVPYRYKTKVWKEQTVNGEQKRIEVEETAFAKAFFLPDELAIEGALTPSKLHRGIYDAVVYEGKLELSGRFPAPDFAELGIAEDGVQWGNAVVTLAVSDLRGTGKMLTIQVGGKTYPFIPGCTLNGYASGISARLPDIRAAEANLDFRMTLELKGNRGIQFAPVGRKNVAKLTSSWPAPSFCGAFLPTERTVSDQGFEASWEVSWYGRSYPQRSTDQAGNRAFSADMIAPSLFGVNCLVLLDSYRLVERAVKYGALFIALIFTAFFLFEVLSALRIHTIQYTLVGAALCLFYLAVLSLSEFLRFGYAYWIAATASALLIILYSLKVLGSGRRTTIIAAALLIIYTYLYVVLQSQDYSLLLGTVCLFAVLGILMYSTRNLDWTARRGKEI